MAPRSAIHLAQSQELRQLQLECELVQGILLDQVGSHAIGHPRAATQAHVQQVSNGQIEHRVAQEFEAFVMVAKKAAVGQRPFQQIRIGENVLQSRCNASRASRLALLGSTLVLEREPGRAGQWISRS